MTTLDRAKSGSNRIAARVRFRPVADMLYGKGGANEHSTNDGGRA